MMSITNWFVILSKDMTWKKHDTMTKGIGGDMTDKKQAPEVAKGDSKVDRLTAELATANGLLDDREVTIIELEAKLAEANGLLDEVGEWQAQPFHINTYTDLLSILAKRREVE